MAKITISRSNVNYTAPKKWRKIENALLIAIIPAIVLVLTNWGFSDEKQLNRILLIVSTLLPALIKGIGLILADDEEKDKESVLDSVQLTSDGDPNPPSGPKGGNTKP